MIISQEIKISFGIRILNIFFVYLLYLKKQLVAMRDHDRTQICNCHCYKNIKIKEKPLRITLATIFCSIIR